MLLCIIYAEICGGMQYVTSENKKAYFTDNELRELRKIKVANKISDIDYLKSHPEIEQIIDDYYKKVLDQKPEKDQIYQFSAQYFRGLNDQRCKALE